MSQGVYPSRNNWSAGELEFLAEAPAAGLTMLEVAAKLGRSHAAVKCLASKLGVLFPRQAWGVATQPWTEEQDQFLAEMAPTTPHVIIAKHLGRTRTAVSIRAQLLGIKGRSKTEYATHGSDSPTWRGGSSEQGMDRGEDWPEFRLLALERDSYTCQDCSLFIPSGKGLVVHHMIPWRLRPVNELHRLVTLCVTHHMRRPEHWWREIPDGIL